MNIYVCVKQVPDTEAPIRIKTDAGEELEVTLRAGETTRAPDGRHFSTRYSVDLARLRQPCREVRVRGEIWALRLHGPTSRR